MKKIAFIDLVILLGVGGLLIGFAPNSLSIVMISVMVAIMVAGMLFGIIPTLMYADGFRNGIKNIDHSLENQTNGSWMAVMEKENFFHHRVLDRLFSEYQDKVRNQRENKQIVADIEEYINEDVLFYQSWQGVLAQIPGSLTGLGILGTFLGLITGIGDISISSVEATVESIQYLLNGIEIAFYTSIAGVSLSIIYNFIYKTTWNIMNRELAVFLNRFHKQVIPAAEEQMRYRERQEFQLILERLDRIPKKSFSASGSLDREGAGTKEKAMLSQVMQALKDEEIKVFLQPRYNIISQEVVGAEALVRWQHKTMGVVSPYEFLPLLEKNGYITKLDQYVWKTVVETIRRWIDEGKRVKPISVNITRTDILALDVVEVFDGLLQEYKVPPRYFEIDLAQNIFQEAGEEVKEVVERLRTKGLRVVFDGFDGDFFSLGHEPGQVSMDALKLDLRQLQNNQKILAIFETAKKLNYSLIVEGIENMEQVNMLRRQGCSEGQGYYFSKPLSIEEYERKYMEN